MAPHKLLHIINGLDTGGAEMMLYKLLSATDRSQFESAVISLRDRGTLGEQIEALGVPVHTVGMARGRPTPARRFLRLARRLEPDLIQGWMYQANLAAWLAGHWPGSRVPVLWNIRHSVDDLRVEKWRTAALIRVGARLSSYPEAIVYNARASARQHAGLGYAMDRQRVIPNGFDCERFRPRAAARSDLRQSLGLALETLLVGLVARHHPMKDHATFLRAAALLAADRPAVHFVLVGRDVSDGNAALKQQIQAAGLEARVNLLGERAGIEEIMAGLDIFTLTSAWGEGFPNVVGEAMACGTPCVVTDVGDAAWIVGGTGAVVPRRDPEALARAWRAMVELGPEGRARLGQVGRQRVQMHFALPHIVAQYETLHREVLVGC